MASAILINLDYVSAESLNKKLSSSEEALNDLGLNIENKKDSLEGSKVDNDIFGAPTFVVNNKIFWGQDRLEYALEEYDY